MNIHQLILPNFSANHSEENVSDPEKTFKFSDDENFEVMDEFSIQHMNEKSKDFANRNVTRGIIHISDLNAKQSKSPKKTDCLNELKERIFKLKTQNLGFFNSQKDAFLRNLEKLNFKSFINEIQSFPDVIGGDDLVFSEKLLYIWYMKVILRQNIINKRKIF